MTASNCPNFHVPTLNEKISNENIHQCYKRNYKRRFDQQNLVLKATAAVVNVANLCLEADNKNEVIHSKGVVLKAFNAIILVGNMNHQVAFERKERLRNALSEDYITIYGQDHSESKELLRDDLADNVKKAEEKTNKHILNRLHPTMRWNQNHQSQMK